MREPSPCWWCLHEYVGYSCPCCGESRNGWKSFEPTTDEIRAACEAIQASWTEQEREHRRVGAHAVPWSVPECEAVVAEQLMEE